MRHAKAEPYAASDHVRRLTDRGVESARDVGRYLRDHDLSPDYVAVSSATRTRQTWAAVAESLPVPESDVSFDDALFTGSADVVVEVLHSTPADAGTVMFVGHNPSAAYLCHYLDDGDGDSAAVSSLLQGFPPSAVAVLEIGVPWADLGPETGRIVDYYVGVG
jgi:phosphohistidine phosphatase